MHPGSQSVTYIHAHIACKHGIYHGLSDTFCVKLSPNIHSVAVMTKLLSDCVLLTDILRSNQALSVLESTFVPDKSNLKFKWAATHYYCIAHFPDLVYS